ncbi:hypothetical protein Q0S22_20095, partial [Escherichia coli O93:H19]
MKKILEAILAINLAVLSCIVFINIILRYGFQTSILSVDELSRYLFVGNDSNLLIVFYVQIMPDD